VKREPEGMYVRVFMAVCAWLCVHIFKVMLLNLNWLCVRRNEILHDKEIRYVKLNINVYGVEISDIGLGDLNRESSV